jgi:hypothetical protein
LNNAPYSVTLFTTEGRPGGRLSFVARVSKKILRPILCQKPPTASSI